MKKTWFFFNLLILLLLAACMPAVSEYEYSETEPPEDVYSAAYSSELTAEAARATAVYYGGQVTATAESARVNATGTQAEWKRQVTATQAEFERSGTATAWSVAATASAAITATAASWTATSVEAQMQATGTAMQEQTNLNSAAMQAKVEAVRLAAERDRRTNLFKTWIPWIFSLTAAAWLLITATRRERIKTVQRDARGDAPLLLDVVDGQFTDPDRSPNYAGSARTAVADLPGVTPERQDAVTHNDQLVDLAVRGLPGATNDRRRQQVGQSVAATLPDRPTVQIVPAERVGDGILDEIAGQVVEE